MHNTNYSDAPQPTAQMLNYASLVFSEVLCTVGLQQARELWGHKGASELQLCMYLVIAYAFREYRHSTLAHTGHPRTHTHTDSQLHTISI